MAEKLKNLVNEVVLDYILECTSAETATEQKHTTPEYKNIGDVFFSREIVDFISKRDCSFLERIEGDKANPALNDKEFEELMHKYGAIMFYDLFEKALQKKDKKYFASVKKKILEKAGDAEIDIEHLEKMLPAMKSLNVMFGMYHREYTMNDKEEASFGYSITTGRQKPKIVWEKDFIIPYNLRKNNKITASALG